MLIAACALFTLGIAALAAAFRPLPPVPSQPFVKDADLTEKLSKVLLKGQEYNKKERDFENQILYKVSVGSIASGALLYVTALMQ